MRTVVFAEKREAGNKKKGSEGHQKGEKSDTRKR